MKNVWPDMDEKRQQMIDTIRHETTLCAGYIGRNELSERVLEVMENVPRHQFVPRSIVDEAYDNAALPAGHGQTISQPFIVALMTDLLDMTGAERVLEVGTGTGYQTAILAHLAREVFSIERIPELAAAAGRRLEEMGLKDRVHLHVGNGWHGWPEQSPFDAIIVTAAPGRIPEALMEQLASGGRMAIPVGPVGGTQQLLRVEKSAAGELNAKNVLPVAFVPLLEKA